ncbi:hypothetical protein A5662_07395 [Mycobacteriaceae bacterium 1482268.1]|nr:hypothetical protein A5662_07395 [Mycobacteriaceae bacterium 1482268.1]
MASIQRARSLFGAGPQPSPAPNRSAGVLHSAAENISAAGTRMGELSGQFVDSYRTFADRNANTIAANSRTDTALGTQLAKAAALARTGATQLDKLSAQAQAIAQIAGLVKTPGDQASVLKTLQTLLSHADSVVTMTERQAAEIAGEIRALTYDLPLTPQTEEPKSPKDKKRRGWWDDPKEDKPDPLKPGEVRNLGPVAGTGADPGIPGIGAADLGEVVKLPDGRYVAIFGDSFSGDKMGEGLHYASVAVPVTFDKDGRPIFGAPMNLPEGMGTGLFPPPPQAQGTNTLPAGSIQMRDGRTFMMVAGTKDLKPSGGTWMVETNNNPSGGWAPIDGTYRAPQPAMPSQISGYEAADGNVYIAADSFDRSQGVTMYRVDADSLTDRSAWQPWTGNDWGTPGQAPMALSDRNIHFGELSMREVDGRVVLSGFNASNGPGAVEVRVAGDPTSLFAGGRQPTVLMQQSDPSASNFVPQNYGGYILPGSTLDNMKIFASQWNTTLNVPYNTQEIIANVTPTK